MVQSCGVLMAKDVLKSKYSFGVNDRTGGNIGTSFSDNGESSSIARSFGSDSIGISTSVPYGDRLLSHRALFPNSPRATVSSSFFTSSSIIATTTNDYRNFENRQRSTTPLALNSRRSGVSCQIINNIGEEVLKTKASIATKKNNSTETKTDENSKISYKSSLYDSNKTLKKSNESLQNSKNEVLSTTQSSARTQGQQKNNFQTFIPDVSSQDCLESKKEITRYVKDVLTHDTTQENQSDNDGEKRLKKKDALTTYDKRRSISPYMKAIENMSVSNLLLKHKKQKALLQKGNDFYFPNCLHVKPEGCRPGTLIITESHLIFDYDDEVDGFHEQKEVVNMKVPFESYDDYQFMARKNLIQSLRPPAARFGKQVLERHNKRDYDMDDVAFTYGVFMNDFNDIIEDDDCDENKYKDNVAMSPNSLFRFQDVDTEDALNEQQSYQYPPSPLFDGIDEEEHPKSSSDCKLDCSALKSILKEAKLRLQELEEYDEYCNSMKIHSSSSPSGSISSSPQIHCCHSNSSNKAHNNSCLGSISSNGSKNSCDTIWDKEYLKMIERKAKHYLQKLEDYNDNENNESDEEIDNKSNTSSMESELESKKCKGRDKDETGNACFPSLDGMSSKNNADNTNFLDNQNHLYNNRDCFWKDEKEERFYRSNDSMSTPKEKGIKWALHNLYEIYPRRYQMWDNSVEIFGPPPSKMSEKDEGDENHRNKKANLEVPIGSMSNVSIFISLPQSRTSCEKELLRKKSSDARDLLLCILQRKATNLNLRHWHTALNMQRYHRGMSSRVGFDKNLSAHWLHHSSSLTILSRAWMRHKMSTFDYLLRINALAGRSFHDLGHYPVMPWVLSNYTSLQPPDLNDIRNFRDMKKPMGALTEERLSRFLEKYKGLVSSQQDDDDDDVKGMGFDSGTAVEPPFMYGSHYSSRGGVVLHYLVRLRPFAGLHRQLQGGAFDVPNRLFDSVQRTWDMCSRTSPTDVKELTPEWYSDSSFLRNECGFEFGRSLDGKVIDDVVLPPWANGNADKFVQYMRKALESDICSAMLPNWIDLIFGFKQKGAEAAKACNLFYHLTYYDPQDLDEIKDEEVKKKTEMHIADFGHCPTQLFFRRHPNRILSPLSSLEH